MILRWEITEWVFEPLHHLHASVIAQGFELFENHEVDATLFYEMFKAPGVEGAESPQVLPRPATDLRWRPEAAAQARLGASVLPACLHHVDQRTVTEQNLAAGLGDLFAALVFAFTA